MKLLKSFKPKEKFKHKNSLKLSYISRETQNYKKIQRFFKAVLKLVSFVFFIKLIKENEKLSIFGQV